MFKVNNKDTGWDDTLFSLEIVTKVFKKLQIWAICK